MAPAVLGGLARWLRKHINQLSETAEIVAKLTLELATST